MSDSAAPTHPEFPKVTAYVTCERDGLVHLLLFRHPLAGVQLPAGSIEEGEDPIAAAVREVAEETGLRDVTDPVSLGATTTHLPPGSRILLRTEVPLLGTNGDSTPSTTPSTTPNSTPSSTPSSTPLRRGLTVELIETIGRRAHVRADVLDHEETPPVIVSRREGWIDVAALGSTVVRHHVHLRHHSSTSRQLPENGRRDNGRRDNRRRDNGQRYKGQRYKGQDSNPWTQLADGHVLAPFWAPLVPRPTVCASQVEWLELAYGRLLRRASR